MTNAPPNALVPPHDLAVEQAIIGAALLESRALPLIADTVRPEMFYKPAHETIFRAMLQLEERREPVDLILVVDRLREMGQLEACGGAYYVSELTSAVAGSANIEFHARLLADLHMRRETIAACSRLRGLAFDQTTDCFEALSAAQEALLALSSRILGSASMTVGSMVPSVVADIEARMVGGGGTAGISTGLAGLDNITSGWMDGELYIIAARPAMGKTAFMLAAARHAALECKKPVLIFSLEMTDTQLVERMIAAEALVDGQALRDGRTTMQDIEKIMALTSGLIQAPAQVIVNEAGNLDIHALRSEARRMKRQKGIGMVMVDYLQLMSGTSQGRNGNREQEVSGISRGLKLLAKELKIPVVALSQLSREVEKRGGEKRPILSDIRESGSIEQDADAVMFLYRPEYYGFKEDEEGNSTTDVCEIIVAKQRNGPVDTAKAMFVRRYGKFYDIPKRDRPREGSNYSYNDPAGF